MGGSGFDVDGESWIMRSFQFSCLQAITGWPRAEAAEGDGCTFAGGIAGGTSSADGCASALLGRTV